MFDCGERRIVHSSPTETPSGGGMRLPVYANHFSMKMSSSTA